MEQEKDIVERLRNPLERVSPDDTATLDEAADEIERLRGRLERASQQIGHLMAIRDAQSAILGQERDIRRQMIADELAKPLPEPIKSGRDPDWKL